ncbi:UDP-2,3-diacylglucosamine diphosphatase [Marivirga harenae]|uniref:UDP-2,3-diacylglucosamine diphosphatase n=1 Tax=Marivirga harenae TaxID=2010992 RepID=UPI0026DECBF6|nr:UDP-2,3-diacylglucosamine diphosphatase [Marivirga harenae]WKV13563.1 UDP-2,3-diacylglucosamine diphosphatase [Marivirga harenae]|tara:strand:+ start:202153 stop:202929 length:777 start_codon:yes stop_codon:yes gene_type:complete
MKTLKLDIPASKKIYFASDFHLGAPNSEESHKREQRIVRWMNHIQKDASALFLVGDIFDFWHEYKTVVPKGFVRFQGKLAELADGGLPIYFFTGNHDMWMFGYFKEELGIDLFREPLTLLANDKKFLIGHGDGLGPGDRQYKFLKKVFANKLCQWLFRQIHPDLGIRIANSWSASSRISSSTVETEKFLGEGEWLWTYAKEIEKHTHYDYFVFGHRHLPLDLEVAENSRYINLGEWVNYNTFASFNGKDFVLEKFEDD